MLRVNKGQDPFLQCSQLRQLRHGRHIHKYQRVGRMERHFENFPVHPNLHTCWRKACAHMLHTYPEQRIYFWPLRGERDMTKGEEIRVILASFTFFNNNHFGLSGLNSSSVAGKGDSYEGTVCSRQGKELQCKAASLFWYDWPFYCSDFTTDTVRHSELCMFAVLGWSTRKKIACRN